MQLLSDFFFFHVEETEEVTGIKRSTFIFFLFNCNFDSFKSAITNNQTKCGITYKKIAMRPDDL